MRNHLEIIRAAGGTHALASLIEPHLPVDLDTAKKRVRQWPITGSIPGEYWALLDRLGVATMDELAGDAASRKGVTLPDNDAVVSGCAA